MRCVIWRSVRDKHPDAVRRLLVQQLEPATRLLSDVCPRTGTVERALLAVTADVRAPLLSLTARATDVLLRLRHRNGYLLVQGRRQARRREALPRRTVSCEGPRCGIGFV